MFPELLSFGPFALHSYGFLIAVGVFLALFFMTRSARKGGFPPPEKVWDLVFVVVLAGFLGARIFYVVQEGAYYLAHPWEVLQIWKGGVVYYGGMITSLISVLIYARRTGLPVLKTTDFVICYVPLVHAFGRVGCFLNGCCFGKASSLPWAVQFPSLAVPVHPVQLYESLFNLALFGSLVWFYRRRQFTGQMTSLYLIAYGAGRFFLEFFRGDQMHWHSPLTLHQLLSLASVAAGVLLYGICRRTR